MKIWKNLFITAAAAGLLFTSACNKDYTGKETTHPLFAKGLSCKTSQNYSKATEAFESFLVICPKSPRTHKELAELYGEYLGDYLKAVYHYEKYLELAKPGMLDSQDTRKLIDSNKRKFYEKYQQENGLTAPDVTASAHDQADLDRIAALEASLKAQKDMYGKVIEKYKELAKTNTKLFEENKLMRSRIKSAVPGAVHPASAGTSSANAGAVSDVGEGKTYTVKPGDTLSRISTKVYGRAGYWTKIRDANASLVGANGSVKVGQVLQIPRITPAGPAVRPVKKISVPKQEAAVPAAVPAAEKPVVKSGNTVTAPAGVVPAPAPAPAAVPAHAPAEATSVSVSDILD